MTPPITRQSGRTQAAFTIVELLAAVAVLAVILVLLSQIIQNTLNATTASKKNMDATGQARNVLDAIRDDLDTLVWEHEASTVFARPNNGNSELLLLTRKRAPSGTAGIRYQAVAYSLEGTHLTRQVSLVQWSKTDLAIETLKAFQSPDPELTTVIAEGVLRFEVMALLRTGTEFPRPPTEPNLQALSSPFKEWHDSGWHGAAITDNFVALKLREVRALVVGVAACDPQSLKLPGVPLMAEKLPETPNGKTPHETWTEVLESGELARTYPLPAVRSVRILQATLSTP